MIDLCNLPVLASGISVHGTGFQSDLWLGNLAVVAFVVWAFRSGGKKALALTMVPALALVATEAHAAAYVERPFWDGMDITPFVIFAALVWIAGGKKEKPKPKKPSASKPDPMAEVLASVLRSGKKVFPLALGIALTAAPFAQAFGLFESDGDRAIKRAEAERIQAENRMAERSHSYVLARARKPEVTTRTVVKETGVPWWMALGSTVLSVAVLGLLYIREEGRRMMAERELEQYQVFYGRAHDLLCLQYRDRGGADAVDALLLEADTDGRA
ncbi:MAG: hypothetical protein ACLFPR_16165 [Desulfococcaceae bacterium]